MPEPTGPILLATSTFMAGTGTLPIGLVVVVEPAAYLALGTAERFRVARAIGVVNRALAGRNAMLIGPGRWGTSTPSLGVPAHFTDLNRFVALVETTYAEGDFRPELSYGSHFFQELVEAGMLYAAIEEGRAGTSFDRRLLGEGEDLFASMVDDGALPPGVIRVVATPGLTVRTDPASARLEARFAGDVSG